nr:MAG TPA: hypothetical protein [Caudoviricetes sp.]
MQNSFQKIISINFYIYSFHFFHILTFFYNYIIAYV